MPERFRRSRTRYENNEGIYVGGKGEKGRTGERALQTNGGIFTPVVITSLFSAFYRSLGQFQIATRVVLSYCRT